MTRLLVECTYVFEHPKVNSGIQRVVRNVIRELPEADETVECIPVAMLDGTLYQVHSLAPLDPRPHSPLVRLRILVERAANYFWLGQRTLEKRRPFRSSPWARRLLYVACRLFAFAFLSIPLRLLDRILGKQQPAPVRATPLEHRAGDQLVLLDSSWHADFFPLAERLKSEGVGIVSVIYDLIPLTHPQFCDAGLVKVFNHWFDWIAATADGYVAISETIRDEVRADSPGAADRHRALPGRVAGRVAGARGLRVFPVPWLGLERRPAGGGAARLFASVALAAQPARSLPGTTLAGAAAFR